MNVKSKILETRLIPIKRTIEDAKLILTWENEIRCDQKLRNNSFCNQIIKWEEHWDWFNRLKIDDCYFIGADGKKAGFIRCGIKDSNIFISVLVSIPWQGKGLGRAAILEYSKLLKKKYKDKKILAEVFNHNRSSIKVFLNASYKIVDKNSDSNLIILAYSG